MLQKHRIVQDDNVASNFIKRSFNSALTYENLTGIYVFNLNTFEHTSSIKSERA